MACTVGAVSPGSLLGLVWACFPVLMADMRCEVPLVGKDVCSGPSVNLYPIFLNVTYLLSVGWALLVPWPINPRLGDAYVYCS